MRRFTLALSVSVLLPALAQPRPVCAQGCEPAIGSNQQFGGLVNGASANATVRMACFGPIRPGQTGHPMANQPLAVIQGPYGGYTGSLGNSVVARFREDPSVGVQFTQYGVAQPIPASLELPCAGQGLVIFSPEPSSSTARPATVTVNYVEEGELAARCRHPCLPSIHLDRGWLAKLRAPRGGPASCASSRNGERLCLDLVAARFIEPSTLH